MDQAQRLRDLSQARKQNRVLAVTSGKGGVGKSNISVNLGISLAKLGGQVLLLDADLGMANVDLLIGMTPKYSLQHVIAGKRRLAEIVMTGPHGIKIIPGVSGALGISDLTKDQRDRFLKELHHLEIALQTDYIIIDTSAGMSNTVINFLLAADDILLVTTPEPTAMMDAYAIIKNVVKRCPEAQIKTIVNMAKSKKEAEYVHNTLSVISDKFLKFKPEFLGYVVRDENVMLGVKDQTPFVINKPYTSASVCLKSIASKLSSATPSITSFKGIKQLFEKAFILSKV